MPFDALIPLLTACGVLMGAIFGALRFNRDDATALVAQQEKVLASMRGLNDDLQEALDRERAEHKATRDELRAVTR